MLSSLARILLRFRWPLVLALIVFFVLYNVMQPRPAAVYRLPILPNMLVDEQFKLSPSGRYAALLEINGCRFHLFDLHSRQHLFSAAITDSRSIGFDDDDGLVFVTTRGENFATWLQWHYWRAGMEKPSLVYQRKIELGWNHFMSTMPNDIFMGMQSFDDSYCECRTHLLSPDARTWLAIRETCSDYVVDMIDAQTGQVRATLENLAISKTAKDTRSLEVCYSHDGQSILIQRTALVPENAIGVPLESSIIARFDAQTGKVLSQDKKPRPYRFVQLLHFDAESILALKKTQHFISLQRFHPTNGYTVTPLPETLPPAIEKTTLAHPDSLDETTVVINDVNVSEDKFLFSWQHEVMPRGMSGNVSYVPGLRFSLRYLITNQFIHTQTFLPVDGVHWTGDSEEWRVITLLPDQCLLLKDPGVPLANWQKSYEEWRKDRKSWPELFSTDRSCVRLVDGRTGSTLFKLSGFGPTAIYHQGTKSIWHMGRGEEDITLTQFKYPIRHPWVLIIGWTVAVLTALVVVQLLGGLFFRTKPHLAPALQAGGGTCSEDKSSHVI